MSHIESRKKRRTRRPAARGTAGSRTAGGRAAGRSGHGNGREVAVILDPSHSYQRRILRGIAEHVHNGAGWRLFIEPRVADMVPDPRTWQGHGVIAFFGSRRTERLVEELQVPAVSIERGPTELSRGIPVVATDNAAIGRLGAAHLLDRGFRSLAYCGAPEAEYWCGPREEAFAEAARGAGATCRAYLRHQSVARAWPAMLSSLAEWVASLPVPTGILAANDARARHVVEACRMAGRRVPEDLAVLGVDNDEMLCELTTPPLSSIEHDARGVGRRAAEMLEALMDGRQCEPMLLVPPVGVTSRRSTDTIATLDADVSAAIAFLRANVDRPVHLDDVARATGLALSTLKSRFKTVVGRPVHAELQRLRIEEARRLLASTSLPVKKVAGLVGFGDISHFTTAFRRHTGLPPGRYRNQSSS